MKCNIALDGNGIWNVNIQNLTITDCDVGINLIDCLAINVTNNSVTNFQEGIRLIGARTCIIEGNIVSGDVNSNYGIVLGTITPVSTKRDSIGNKLYNNTIENNSYGIYIWGLSPSTAKNQIFNNNFINNAVENAEVRSNCDPDVNVFNGNYWDDWDGATIPYTFPGGKDNNPLMPTAETKLQELIGKVEGYNWDNGINNALDAKLQNALDALTASNAGQRQDAVNKMEAFINAVQAQSGNQIPEDIASDLISDAQNIIAIL